MFYEFSGFVKVPSPPVMILTTEERHVYMCNHSETDKISWRVNDKVLGIETFLNFTSGIISLPGGGRVYTLTVRGLPEHNETTIQCSAAFSDGSLPDVTPPVTLLTQGRFSVSMVALCLMIKRLIFRTTTKCEQPYKEYCYSLMGAPIFS